MRSCRPFAIPSSRDEITSTQAAMDEEETPATLLAHIGALARSEEQKDVLRSLDFIKPNSPISDRDQRKQLALLHALATYRLRRDAECLEIIKQAESENLSTTNLAAIAKEIHKEKAEREKDIAAGVGIGATLLVGIAAIVTAVLFGRKKR